MLKREAEQFVSFAQIYTTTLIGTTDSFESKFRLIAHENGNSETVFSSKVRVSRSCQDFVGLILLFHSPGKSFEG